MTIVISRETHACPSLFVILRARKWGGAVSKLVRIDRAEEKADICLSDREPTMNAFSPPAKWTRPKMRSESGATVTAAARASDAPATLILAVVGPGVMTTYPLPARGEITIGRGASARLCIEDASISRIHAIVRAGDTATVEDAGSKNGTRVGNHALAPGERKALRIGDTLELGSVVIVMLGSAPCLDKAPSKERADAEVIALESVGSGAEPRIVVREPEMLRLYRLAQRVAASELSVLILGESGSGKEVLAETLHRNSRHRDKTLRSLNCAALSENLLESELFGHEKGAFSGAVQAKAGLLEMDGGTVFLDEVGDMPPSLQAKLLRVIEHRMVTRVGGLRPKPIDVRFVAATNRNLTSDVVNGRFRADLYYRLNGITLDLPPLRQRLSEIEPLAQTFLSRAALKAGMPRAPTLSREAVDFLVAYKWPGNIRELRNVIERALVVCGDSDEITFEHISLDEVRSNEPRLERVGVGVGAPSPPQSRREEERRELVEMLARCGGNQSLAAHSLGIARTTLIARIIEYDLPRPRRKRRTE